jgi:cobalt-zinc-cadmium efflux system outer membrane protein
VILTAIMKHHFYIFAVVLCVGASKGAAGEVVLSVADAVRTALTDNPTLNAARLTIREAKGRSQDAGRLPNPELESSFAPNVKGGGEGAFTVGFNQSFPLTARLRVERRISQIQLALAQAEVADFERNLAFQVRTAAVTAAILNAHYRLKDQQITNSRALENAVRDAARVGESSELDLAQLELETGRLLAQRAQIETSRSEIFADLSQLLGATLLTNWEISSAILTIPLDVTWSSALEQRPDYKASLHRVEAAREAIRLARANRWQDIELGVFTGIDREEDAPNGLETDYIAGVRLAVPLPVWNRGKGRIAEAEAFAERVELEKAALVARIRTEIDSSRNQSGIATKLRATISSDLLPKARRLEERLTMFHQQGQATFLEVLRARERRLELESAELDALRDVQLAQARYLAATGGILESQ